MRETKKDGKCHLNLFFCLAYFLTKFAIVGNAAKTPPAIAKIAAIIQPAPSDQLSWLPHSFAPANVGRVKNNKTPATTNKPIETRFKTPENLSKALTLKIGRTTPNSKMISAAKMKIQASNAFHAKLPENTVGFPDQAEDNVVLKL